MMKRILLAACLTFFAAPAFAACAVTNLQVKDNAAVTANVPYADDGSGASNCSPQIQIKQGGNVQAVKAASTAAAQTDPAAVVRNADVGTTSDSAYTGGTGSVIAILKGLYTGITSAIPAGTNVIGGFFGSPNVTPTDCSLAITTGGTAQNIISASATIHGFTIANIDTSAGSGEPVWFSFTTTAAASTIGSYPLAAPTVTTFANLASYTTPVGFGSNHAVSVIAATTGHKISCTFW
jgi:hypothetical protein